MKGMNPSVELGPVRIYFGEKNGMYPDGNQVIVQGTRQKAVFDSPLVSNRIGDDFDQADLVIQSHIHEDHMAGLHRLNGTPVYVHKKDLPAAKSWEGYSSALGYADPVLEKLRGCFERDFYYGPTPDAIGYDNNTIWNLGGNVQVRAIHMPGHTAGHCVLLVEPVGVAFIGDIDLASFGPYYGDRTSSLKAFRDSLDRLADIPAKAWIVFHHRGLYTDRKKFLRDLSAYREKLDEREQRLLSNVKGRPKKMSELIAAGLMYNPGYDKIWVKDTERHTISQHLTELIASGKVAVDAMDRYRIIS